MSRVHAHVHVCVVTPAANPPASRLATLPPFPSLGAPLPLLPPRPTLPPPQPEEVYEVYTALNAVKGGRFTIAAAFGNVHGVYSPGNVQLTPEILHNCQKYIKEKDSCDAEKPATFVFHGGSGSSREDIRYAIEAGTVKMNIDTDTQWAFWDGLRSYEAEFRPYLQGQIGNPDGDEKPNKKYYDPRMALRRGEEFMAKRLVSLHPLNPERPLTLTPPTLVPQP